MKCYIAFNYLALPPGRTCRIQSDFLAVSLFDVKIKLDDFFSHFLKQYFVDNM